MAGCIKHAGAQRGNATISVTMYSVTRWIVNGPALPRSRSQPLLRNTQSRRTYYDKILCPEGMDPTPTTSRYAYGTLNTRPVRNMPMCDME